MPERVARSKIRSNTEGDFLDLIPDCSTNYSTVAKDLMELNQGRIGSPYATAMVEQTANP
jgi:hypothetical protein